MKAKGSILVFVLFFIAFAASTGIFLLKNSSDSYRGVVRVYSDTQSYIYAATAIEAIKKLLKEDDNGYDSKEDDWFNIPSFPVGGGYVNVKVIPLNAKINLNIFYSGSRELRERLENAFEYALDEYGVGLEVEYVWDWIDREKEREILGLSDKAYTFKNGKLDTLFELSYIPGFSRYYAVLKRFFTAGFEKKINMNFASEDIIDAFLPELSDYSQDIIKYRDVEPFKDVSNIKSSLDLPEDVYLKVLPFMTVKSSYFYAMIKVKLNDDIFTYHVILKRNGKKVKVLKYIEGGNEEYF